MNEPSLGVKNTCRVRRRARCNCVGLGNNSTIGWGFHSVHVFLGINLNWIWWDLFLNKQACIGERSNPKHIDLGIIQLNATELTSKWARLNKLNVLWIMLRRKKQNSFLFCLFFLYSCTVSCSIHPVVVGVSSPPQKHPRAICCSYWLLRIYMWIFWGY